MIEPRSHIPILNIPKPKKPKSRLTRGGGIRPVSAKRAKLNKIYSALRKKFLAEHPLCQWWLSEVKNIEIIRGYAFWPDGVRIKIPESCDVHHKKGRGKYLLDVSTWMAVSRAGHDAIHADPKKSYEKGYMLPRN